MAGFEDYYEILQIHPSAEPEIIEAAYKKLAAKYHPDKDPSRAAEERMKKINIAHDVLRDPVQREKYHAEWVQKGEKKTSRGETDTPTRSKPSSKSHPGRQRTATPKPSPSTQPLKNKGKIIAYAVAGLFVLIAIPLILVNTVFSTHSTAKVGDSVQVHYTGTLEDGTVFDSSEGRDPLEFVVGSGQVIPGLDKAVRGMEVGEKKIVTTPAEEAYGPHRDEQVVEISREKLPSDLTPEVGQQLVITQSDGMEIVVVIISVSGDAVTIDANHPLAGKDLVFEIELVKIL